MTWLGPAQFLTPEQAEEQLATPVFFILAGFAQPSFPHSSTASQSPYVLINRMGKPAELRHSPRFPISVNWKQWRDAVVPVLEDPRFEVRAPMTRRTIESGSINEAVRLIGAALRQSFTAAGYGPST